MDTNTKNIQRAEDSKTKQKKPRIRRKSFLVAAVFVLVNLFTFLWLTQRESSAVDSNLSSHITQTQTQFDAVMKNYTRSFQLFSQMMTREIEHTSDPDAIWTYLKSVDQPLLNIEGATFDGLYMYYQGRYLYSWDTPYSQYANTGYVVTERPWYQAAVAGRGEIVFTPPYMSYANHYILTTISQLQPDGETVFAYDIKMGDIQALVSSNHWFNNEQMMIFDENGTIIGSTNTEYLGGDLNATVEDTKRTAQEAQAALDATDPMDSQNHSKAEDQANAAAAFHLFRTQFGDSLSKLQESQGQATLLRIDGTLFCGSLGTQDGFHFLTLVPLGSAMQATMGVWLVPLLLIELLLIYGISRVNKELRNRELRAAYVALGQTQRRLELALSAAQNAAAIDDLTGMMNFKSFRTGVMDRIASMEPEDCGILIVIDGDHFKWVNDNYGHSVGDDVIKLSAQMIVGRIRTVDLASRLHGDEFSIFVAHTADYDVAKRIMDDINQSIAQEAADRNIPPITLSSGAVVVRAGDNYAALSKAADKALYVAKETHNGGFAAAERDSFGSNS